MIDARVDDAVKQHHQKMDWLRAEVEATTLTPPPAGSSMGGKMGFNLPLTKPSVAEEVIAPILERSADKSDADLPPSDTEKPTEKDCENLVEKVESISESVTDGETKVEKQDKTGSLPPKDGTPVWEA